MRTRKLALVTAALWLILGTMALAGERQEADSMATSDLNRLGPALDNVDVPADAMLAPVAEPNAEEILLVNRRPRVLPVSNKTVQICLTNKTKTTNDSLRCANRLIEGRPEQGGKTVRDPVRAGYSVHFPASTGVGYNTTCHNAIVDINRPINFRMMVRTIHYKSYKPDPNSQSIEWFQQTINPPYGSSINVAFYPDCTLRPGR
jgi:hypothetical protein